MRDELTCSGRAGSLHRPYIITVMINEVTSICVCHDIDGLSLGFLSSFFVCACLSVISSYSKSVCSFENKHDSLFYFTCFFFLFFCYGDITL